MESLEPNEDKANGGSPELAGEDDAAPTAGPRIHGDADQVVPYSQGEMLFRNAPEPKRFISVPGGSHCGSTGGFRLQETERYRQELLKFFDECVAGQRSP